MATNSLTALITGGTSGIGRAAANKLTSLGIHVIVVGRNAQRGDKTVAEIRAAGGEGDFISADLRGASRTREVARKAIELGDGRVDILINNTGIYPFGPKHEMTEELFENVYSLNVKVPYFLVAELAPLMAKRGKGAVVNLSTMVADYGAPGMSLYGSSKAAINLLTKVWAAEYGPSGVRVNAVSPDLRARKELKQWVKGWRNWPPRRRPAARLHQTRSRKLSCFWPRIVPVLFTAQNSRSMGAAAPFEIRLRPEVSERMRRLSAAATALSPFTILNSLFSLTFSPPSPSAFTVSRCARRVKRQQTARLLAWTKPTRARSRPCRCSA